MIIYGNELYHHGIKGQKWGVRRYQNEDGTYTKAGLERKRTTFSDAARSIKTKYNRNKDTISKIGKAAAIAAVAGISVYAMAKNKEAVSNVLKTVGKNSLDVLSESSKRVGNAMVDAALLSIGTMSIDKLAKKLPTDDSVDEKTRDRNKLLFNTASAGISEATKANRSGSVNNNGNLGKEISDKLGSPSNKGIDRQSSEYQQLFKDRNGNQRDSTTRSMIKSLASNGYDINQIKEYLNGVDNGTIKHSFYEVGEYLVASMLGSVI